MKECAEQLKPFLSEHKALLECEYLLHDIGQEVFTPYFTDRGGYGERIRRLQAKLDEIRKGQA